MKEKQIPTISPRPNLYDLSPAALERELGGIVTPPFRVKQIADWIHLQGAVTFEAMSNLPKNTRGDLAGKFELALPSLLETTEPAADESRKYLFRLDDGGLVEAVYMPMGDRTTICLSSQAGCAVGCTFCVTGFFGAGRNLLPSEIIGQYLHIRKDQQIPVEQLNVVFMGMGEPLLNLDHVTSSLEILHRAISPKRITLSTSGIIPGIRALAKLEQRPNLAVSINAPDRKRREEIMPITKKYPLDDLIATLADFPLERGREITIEYVLLAGYNDAPADAVALAKLVAPLRAKINLIPFNEDPSLPTWMKRPTDRAIDRFADGLARKRLSVTVRRSKGREIAAACGQLRGSELRRSPRNPR